MILPELLDETPPEEAVASLNDLVRINRYLGGYSTLRWMLRRVVKRGEAFSLLDVGAASGDMGAALVRAYPDARVTSLDRKANHLAAGSGRKVIGDAFRLPFQPRAFDFVFCSLFLHHFENEAVIGLLREFGNLARRAVLAIDLERGPVSYRFLPATRWLFRWDPITLHDGPISVRAGFKREELLKLAESAGLVEPEVRVHRPWARLSLVAPVRTSLNTMMNLE